MQRCHEQRIVTIFMVLVQIFLIVSVSYRSIVISRQSLKLQRFYARSHFSTEYSKDARPNLKKLHQTERVWRKRPTKLELLTRKAKNEFVKHDTADENKIKNIGSKKSIRKMDEVLVEDDWDFRSFCYNFLVRTFQTQISVCANTANSAVHCYGTPFSNQMGTCILENVLVNPKHLAKAMENADNPQFSRFMLSIALLSDGGLSCQNFSTADLLKHIESGYIEKIIDHMKQAQPLTSQVCDQWIEEDTFFFTANKVHIYFRFLDYFNLHKMLVDVQSERPQVIKISGSSGYNFVDFDKKLFSDVNFRTLDNLGNGSVCFKKVILVPRSYASFLFRCKISESLRTNCFHCKGKGLSQIQVFAFRDRVLRACLLQDRINYNHNLSLIFASRKPYYRFENDKASKFERVMDNEDILLDQLHQTLKSYRVQRVHLENLDICEQVRVVHDADIYLGVHGAGLVHLWWLRDHAVIYELEPTYEIGNPTFRMLAHLAQRKYIKSRIAGGGHGVHANVKNIVAVIKNVIAKWKLSDSHSQ